MLATSEGIFGCVATSGGVRPVRSRALTGAALGLAVLGLWVAVLAAFADDTGFRVAAGFAA
ncbi:hypothetical protein C4901_15610 [Acidiferrobacter sp. SPIII_3]|uniref:hypothetical protein n=1 Tax=Acidiferrobacter sp. SPIII_3 TaxID=1281578 RepID=UPI000D72F0A5|nr:hypothetical protein [Acidiferrobacter sp. SPIII_3]AWP22488.1 hypothetical protein C4901_03280 [Acidiferrobacter sp. SPIII_3]AWP24575.1 hypothetical protein C4901_15610 [Acidiferrobacter sp. SPIII_3]